MKVDMLEFLKTGRFGPLVHGMRIEEVEKLLGPPQEVCQWYSTEWRYASLSVWSYRGLLEGVTVHYRNELRRHPFRIPGCIELVGPKLSGRATLKQFRDLLGKEGILWTEKDFRPVEESLRVTMNQAPQAVEAWFTSKANLLCLISCFCEVPR